MIPMCWKCASAIIKLDDNLGVKWLIGCKECDKVKDYEAAKEYCPLIEGRKNESS